MLVTRSGTKVTTTGTVFYFEPTKWLTFAVGVEHTSGQRPKAKATANKNKAATNAPKQDKITGRNPDNMDEGTTDVPQVLRQSQKDTRQKKRRMY